MHCSKCGTEVPGGAKFCPGCGQATASAAKAGGADAVKGCVGLVAVIVVLGVGISMCSGGSSDGTGTTQAAANRETVTVSARDLAAAYEANEAAAQAQYGDVNLVVTGTVDGIDLDFADDPVVRLKTPNMFQGVQANLTEDAQPRASGLSKGQVVTLRCASVSEIVGTPILKDCSF